MAHPSSVPSWREFERLVARIEAAVAPLGAIVKSPDRIPSLITGKRREVDASIRSRVGTTEVLITIECRKRRPGQDVTWIEQLVTKRDSLGAARTLAVCNSGFSKEAIALARTSGIDLRLLKDVSPEEVRDWMQPSVVHSYRHSDLLGIAVEFSREPGDAESSDVVFSTATRVSDVALTLDTGRRIGLDHLWLSAQKQADYYGGLAPDGPSAKRRVRLRFPRGRLRMDTPIGVRFVSGLILTMELSLRTERLSLADARVVEYADLRDGSTIRRMELTTTGAAVTNIRLSFQSQVGANEVAARVEAVHSPLNDLELIEVEADVLPDAT